MGYTNRQPGNLRSGRCRDPARRGSGGLRLYIQEAIVKKVCVGTKEEALRRSQQPIKSQLLPPVLQETQPLLPRQHVDDQNQRRLRVSVTIIYIHRRITKDTGMSGTHGCKYESPKLV